MLVRSAAPRLGWFRSRAANSSWIRQLATGLSAGDSGTAAALPDDYSVASGSDSELPRYRKKIVSRALEVYLNDIRAHNKMMARERAEFELGKRHLANIMGLDANNITQEDIDRAIEYLFPSGLSDRRALPVMKPPEEILPKMRQIEFDDEGRPKDLLFFTVAPKFYRLLSYAHLVAAFDHLISLPGAYQFKDLIFEYRKPIAVSEKNIIFRAEVSF
ncbi:unnamed protein product [Gongylonema pulchrum]|uniref:Uncharacterized protein n=1 Tax=Gongylonema pulchrum TaxID=637853 RepID=A0A183E8N6_9BILA|nr:unnamed protein product [Gongylonema pulchrum]